LAQLIRQEHIQIIHAHSSSLFLGSLVSLLTGCRLVWHDHYGPGSARSRSPWPYRLASHRVSQVFSVTRPLANWAMNTLHIPAGQVSYLPNFVSNSAISRKSIELPGTTGQRIVCVANLRPVKDQVNLLRAMQMVVQEHPDAHLLLVGDTSNAEYHASILAEQRLLHLENHVTLMGRREDVAGILACANIAVLASAIEGFPLAILEYGKAHLPVIATNVGECAEILDHGSAGILVEPGNPRALAAALNELLRDPQKGSSLGERLARRVEAMYSEVAAMTTILNGYRSITGGTKSS